MNVCAYQGRGESIPLVTLAEAEAAVKQAREDAFEEAMKLFQQPHCEYFGRDIQAAIESLKGKTP